jgi:hypothetical protein
MVVCHASLVNCHNWHNACFLRKHGVAMHDTLCWVLFRLPLKVETNGTKM